MFVSCRRSDICRFPRNTKIYSEVKNGKERWFINFSNNKTKNYGIRQIPKTMAQILIDYLNTINPNERFMFPSDEKKCGHILSEKMVRDVTHSLQQLGVKDVKGNPYVLHPHSFRHFSATRLAQLGAPVSVIQDQLGHHSPEMTLQYIDAADKISQNAIKNLPSNQNLKIMLNNDDEIYQALVSNYSSVRTLAIGYCVRPCSLDCENENNCFFCNEFRYGSHDIPKLKDYLLRIYNNPMGNKTLTVNNTKKKQLINKIESMIQEGAN